jgi:hypothetical protein
MEELYKELIERLKHLESKKYNKMNLGKITELQLVIVRVQQLLLADLPKKSETEKSFELQEIPEPVGKFIIDNAKGIMGNDGMYYHYSDVCNLLKSYKDKK